MNIDCKNTYTNEAHLEQWLLSIINQADVDDLLAKMRSAPGRISNAYKELLSGYEIVDPRELITITRAVCANEDPPIVMARDTPFTSMCLHHFLPFYGTVDFAYKPGSQIIGIGKLFRLIDYRCSRFNIQEDIATELCSLAMDLFDAKGAYARVTARHFCACYRGPKKYEAFNVVSARLGTIDMEQIGVLLSSKM